MLTGTQGVCERHQHFGKVAHTSGLTSSPEKYDSKHAQNNKCSQDEVPRLLELPEPTILSSNLRKEEDNNDHHGSAHAHFMNDTVGVREKHVVAAGVAIVGGGGGVE